MTDDERIDFFFDRVKADPNLAIFAIIIGPYRATTKDPAALVQILDAFAAHWAAATHAATVELAT